MRRATHWLCLLALAIAACGEATPVPPSTPLPTETPIPTATPTLTPLTDEMAIARIEEALVAYPIHQLEVAISRDLRRATISYETDYSGESLEFQWQVVIIGLIAARTISQVQPPVSGGMRMVVVPTEGKEVGMRLVVIGAVDIAAWASGSQSDQAFVAGWQMVTVTKE